MLEKILDILEKNVQWIVLGLSALFIAWVAYAYVVTPPATVKLGKKVVVAADVDQIIREGPASQLDSQMKPGPKIDFPAQDLVSSWNAHMEQPYVTSLSALALDTHSKEGPVTGPDLVNKVWITSLPQLAKAQVTGVVAGKSVVQPPVPANPAAAGQAPAPPVSKDLLWVSSFGTISGKLLTQSLLDPLKGQPIDPALFAQIYTTSLLEVTLQRQQASGIDAQGKPIFPIGDKGVETVQALTFHMADLQKLPAAKADVKENFAFLTWAQANGQLIATPAFYNVTGGDAWAPPQPPAPAGGPATAPANGATQPADAPAAPAAPAATPPPGANMKAFSPARAQANATFAPVDRNRPTGSAFAAVPTEGPIGGFGPGGVLEGGGAFPRGPAGPGMPFNPQGNLNGGAVPGELSPFTPIADIPIWGHDEIVRAGMTYRYRFIYKMKNPVFAVANQAPPKLTAIFAIASPPSDWTAPITVPETTKFWLAQIGKLTDPVPAKVDVFTWAGGQWNARKNLPVAPGDSIPGTNLTVVDVRSTDPSGRKDKYVLLVNDAGELKQRDLTGDVNDQEHLDMLAQTGGNAPIPPAGPPNTPFRRPVPPRPQAFIPGRQ